MGFSRRGGAGFRRSVFGIHRFAAKEVCEGRANRVVALRAAINR